MKTENFIKIYKAIKEYPYYGEFKLGDIIDLSALGEDKKDILKDFYLFVNMVRTNISVSSKDQDEFLDDFDYIYVKSPNIYESKEDICKVAVMMKNTEKETPFILPEILRDVTETYEKVDVDRELESKINALVTNKYIPNVEILGKAFGYTVYKKL